MKYWPVPNSYSKDIPKAGLSGSLWEDRGDRHHCGIDIYAPERSDVLLIEDGEVTNSGIFTSPEKNSYWNTTYYVLVKNKTGFVCKYAELGDVIVSAGELLKAGQLIGHVGLVLNIDKITENSPAYIQKIKKNGNESMLHFELYRSKPDFDIDYFGGNWFGGTRPNDLLNPVDCLLSTLIE